MSNQQTERVKVFFNEIAQDYSNRYTNERPFLNFFHRQRIKAALRGQDFTGKRIWDIGAGIGILQHFLADKNEDFSYFASDISSEMHVISGISEENYFVGQADNAPISFKDFQSVFLLGVTTYLQQKELIHLLQKTLPERTVSGAQLFITFTHKSSLDFKLRKIIKFFSAFLPENRFVLGQKFTVKAYTSDEIADLLPLSFQIEKIIFLNQSFFLFNRLFPNYSVQLARKTFLRKDSFFKRWLSSDFLVIAHRRQ
ncbi:MAG: hypothetical protein ACI9LN_004252 [Saprospiraceae bacterium]